MPHLIQSRLGKKGAPPGTPVHIGRKKMEKVELSFFHYSADQFVEKSAKNPDECLALKEKEGVLWIDVEGVHDVEIIARLCEGLGIHPLVQEDIVNTDLRPKCDDYNSFLFLVLKMLSTDEKRGEVSSEQTSLILGKNFVVSFQEGKEGDVFDSVREQIRSGKGNIRKSGADFLFYNLMDVIVDHYFSVLERIGEKMEHLEQKLVENPDLLTIQAIHRQKREMIFLRRVLWPLREAISNLERLGSGLVGESVRLYIRDVYDHVIQVMDVVETCRDMLSSMLDIYLSAQANHQNEVMKTLTVIATLFMPLTFLVGVYGMNFYFMPELHWKWGYAGVWGVMLASTLGMLIYFKRKKWF